MSHNIALEAMQLGPLAALAKALKERGMVTPRGGKWHPSSVRNLLARLDRAA